MKQEKQDLDRETCLRCFRPLSHCLCPHIRSFATRTRIVILMHPKEARKIRNGTGRLAHLALRNSEIVTGVDFTDDPKIESLLTDRGLAPFILYPGKTSQEISAISREELNQKGKCPLVFIIDGTWRGARKMMKLSRNLHALPQVAIQPSQSSRFVIKHQPNSSCLSTIESLYHLLTELEKKGLENLEGRHETLMDVLDKLVNIQLSYISIRPASFRISR